MPGHLDLVDAGGIPEVFVTAHDAMRTRAGLQPGEHVLVHAVGSGVGTAVVQLAKAFGNTVTGTARTADKLERARALGLDHGVLAPDPFDAAVLAQAVLDAGGPADVVVELVGGGYVEVDLAVTAIQGRIVIVGTLAGGGVQLPLMTLMSKRLALHGTVLRARTIEEKAAATAAFVGEVAAAAPGRAPAAGRRPDPAARRRRRGLRPDGLEHHIRQGDPLGGLKPGSADPDHDLGRGRVDGERPLAVEPDHPADHRLARVVEREPADGVQAGRRDRPRTLVGERRDPWFRSAIHAGMKRTLRNAVPGGVTICPALLLNGGSAYSTW